MRAHIVFLGFWLVGACGAEPSAERTAPPASTARPMPQPVVESASPATATPAGREARAQWVADTMMSMTRDVNKALMSAGGDCKKAAANLAPLESRARALRAEMDDFDAEMKADPDLVAAAKLKVKAIEPELRKLLDEMEPTMTACQADADFKAAVSATGYMRARKRDSNP